MSRPFNVVLLSVALFSAGGCRALAPADTAPEPGVESAGGQYVRSQDMREALQRDVDTLASPVMMGREAGTAGERRAAAYIADQLDAAGVLPGVDNGSGRSYLQPFNLAAIAFDTVNTRLDVEGLGEARLGDDWIAFPEHTPTVMLDSVAVTFVGYGIAALNQGYDDFSDVNVAGRMAVALAGAPDGLDSVRTFGGTFAPGDFLIKWISAAQRGAAALLVVGEPEALERWEDYSTLATGRSMQLAGESTYVPVMPYMFVSHSYGRRLLDALGAPPTDGMADDSIAVQPFESGRSAALLLLPRRTSASSQNVVGFLPGSAVPEEIVAFGAHYDHLGLKGDTVFSGADDNASGVAAVLATARAMARDARDGRPTDRSLLFVFHAAEEKGLLGAEYLTANPDSSVVRSLDRVVAHINLDMVGREHPDSLYVVGAYGMSSSLGSLLDRVNDELGDGEPLFAFNRAYDDPDDPEHIFERSDHFKYALHGIPVAFLTDGMGANWRKDTAADDYHRVSDDPEKIDLGKLARVALLVYEVGREAADAAQTFPIDGEIPQE